MNMVNTKKIPKNERLETTPVINGKRRFVDKKGKVIPEPWEIVTEALKLCASMAKPGVKTAEIDLAADKYIHSQMAKTYLRGYTHNGERAPFPGAICTNVNDVIAHGFPSDYKLQDGDLVSFDIGVKINNVCGDAALTVHVGTPNPKDETLLRVTKGALMAGIEKVKAGVKCREIGYAIESYCLKRGFVASRGLCGHAIGEEMHMAPKILNFFDFNQEDELSEGMMICIEPLVTRKDPYGYLDKNGWTYRTRNGQRSAVFEHQLLVTSSGCEILTKHI